MALLPRANEQYTSYLQQPCSSEIHVRSYMDLLFNFLNLLSFGEAKKHTRSRLSDFLPVVRKNYQYCLSNLSNHA